VNLVTALANWVVHSEATQFAVAVTNDGALRPDEINSGPMG